MKLTLGFSPCPNDTFIFDALVHGKIDCGGLTFDVVLEDVETLNRWAAEGRLDVTKLSFPALFRAEEVYGMLSSGAALGNGVGPLLISRKELPHEEVPRSRIAVPGLHTTANFLLSYAFPEAKNREVTLFSEIEHAVLSGSADLGVIIHENRFTYGQKGLHKVMDLGEYWEQQTGLPIPLGCIAAKKSLGGQVMQQVEDGIRRSLEYAFSRYPQVPDYTVAHAQEMDPEVMRQHIDLYVNSFSLDLGEAGREAVGKLHAIFMETFNRNHLNLSEQT